MPTKSSPPVRTVVTALAALLACLPVALNNSSAAAAAGESPPPAVVPAQWSVRPAEEAAARLLGDQAERFEFVAEQPTAQGGDHFRISSARGHIVIGGTSPAVILRGLGTYLGQQGMDISWTGSQIGTGKAFRLPTTTTITRANVNHRFALNDTDDGYSGAYRTWLEWQHTIDVLALKGINEVFMPVGAEAVYLDTFEQFGYSESELLKWIPQASHQPWWLLQNMCCFPSPVSKNLVEQRATLGAKIAKRMLQLGITPVLPGYFGTVPPGFAARNPAARTVPQGDWVGFTRPDWLDPTRDPFPAVAAAFYANSQRRFGASSMYKMDLLHEGGNPGSVNVAAASNSVEAALQTAHPGAIWAILGWQNNPRQDTLSAIDKSKMFIVDGLADRYNGMNREQDWHGTKYAFGSIWNFGGHTTMGANIGVWNQRYWQWKAKPDSALDGIAVLPESSNNNPVALDFLTGLAWSDGPVDLPQWYADWAARRYGAADPAAKQAWQVIGYTAYNMPSGTWSEAQDGLFTAEPSLTATSAATWSPDSMRYDSAAFARALPTLLDVAKAQRTSSAYQYDLLDVARQVLSNSSRELLPRIKAAYEAKDREAFQRLTTQWFDEMRLLDEAAGTNKQTLLGAWLRDIKSWGGTSQEVADRQYDARSVLSIWGNRAGHDAGLGDYANREWAGLISTYYLPRWQKYFAELDSALAENRAARPIDWYAYGETWAKTPDASLATTPRGDIYDVAQNVVQYLTAHPAPAAVSAAAATGYVSASHPETVTVSVKNPNSFTALTNVALALEPGAGLTAHATTPAPTTLRPGESAAATYEVDVADGTEPPMVATVGIKASATLAGQSAPVAVRLVTADPPAAPYRTVSFNSAVFGQRGDDFAILGGGADMWGSTNQFGAIHLSDALASGKQATTRVTAQDRTGPWARAGIVVRDDMPTQSSRGYLNLALTPDNGCVLSWDANNDGQLETYSNNTTFSGRAYLRLSRSGNTYTGECSTDGSTWKPVGSATVASAASSDVGLFMTAAGPGPGAAQFHGFTVDDVPPPPPPTAGTHYLSDLPFYISVGGLGPWERDMNNGEGAAGDGGRLVLNGETYAKGLGTNANADATFNLGGSCTRFTATVGIDDSMYKPDADGDVVFRVYRDETKVYDSGVVRAGEVPRSIDVDLTAASTLRLVVDQYDINNWWDRADWANAAVTCS